MLYHAFGVRGYRYLKTAFVGGGVMFACAESFVALSQILGMVGGVAVVREGGQVLPDNTRQRYPRGREKGDIQGPINPGTTHSEADDFSTFADGMGRGRIWMVPESSQLLDHFLRS